MTEDYVQENTGERDGKVEDNPERNGGEGARSCGVAGYCLCS